MAPPKIDRRLVYSCIATLLLISTSAHAGSLVVNVTVTVDRNAAMVNQEINAEATCDYYYSGTDTIAEQLASGEAEIRVTDVGWEWLDDGDFEFDEMDMMMSTSWGSFPTEGTKTIRYTVGCEVVRIDQQTGEETTLATGVGFDEETVQVDVYTVTVTAGRTELAAGAVDTEPHRTTITVEVSPGDPGIQVDLTIVDGGAGYTGEVGENPYRTTWHGPAKLTLGPYWHTPGQPPVNGTTDENGQFTATLISSNQINDSCKVHAQCDEEEDDTATINFTFGDVTLSGPQCFFLGDNEQIATREASDGTPLSWHDLLIFVRGVKVNGAWIEPTQSEWESDFAGSKARVDPYAEAANAQVPSVLHGMTNDDGQFTATITLKYGPEKVKCDVLDLSVHQ